MPDSVTSVTAPEDLRARLVAWITAEDIKGFYPPAGIAARILAPHTGLDHEYVTLCLDKGGTEFLADRCRRIRDWDDLDPDEQTAEMYWHGHGAEDALRARRAA